jgi:ABC-2 type transport system ATP-binding protein
VIEVKGLRKRFGELQAVDDVSFVVAKGEAFGLLGPNGAGKTTTIHMLVGALAPDAGEVRIGGLPDPKRPEVRRQIGLAPQGLALYDELTGAENLAVFGALYGLSGAMLRARVQWALEFSGLADRAKDRADTYSGGMKRRLNLACALVHEPAVLVLDEPTVGVDPQSRNHVFDHGGSSLVQAELEAPPEPGVELPGGTLEGTTLRIDTDRPFELVATLGRSGVSIQQLRVERPDLERVFLKLTGRHLRDP